MEENHTEDNTPWVFSLLVNSHNELIGLRKHLGEFGVETRPYFKPIHTQINYQNSYLFL